MQREEAVELISSFPLAEYRQTLLDHLAPSVRVTVINETEKESGPPSSSYFGGQPSLPTNMTWPSWDKTARLEADIASIQKRFDAYTARTKDMPETIPGIRERRSTGFRESLAKKREQLALGRIPLAFLGQISLREISTVAPMPGWPHEGILAFFYDADQIWGFDPLDRGHCCILFYPENASAAPSEFPAGLENSARFPERLLRFGCEWILPTYLEPDNAEPVLWKTDEYRNLLHQLNSDGKPGQLIHRIGGYPQEVQGDMQLECQLVTHGLYCGNQSAYKDPRRSELEKGSSDWKLVAQFDSDEAGLGWMWGDVGRVYFWARKQDIEAADFGNSWAILQCG
jgi:uncharacterized protein YwqG